MPPRAPIELVSYSPQWVSTFNAERAVLHSVLPHATFRIEHIGSTAVPGLRAKPIIDILIGAPSLDEIESRIHALETLGYQYIREYEVGLPQRRYFSKPHVRPRQFHLHAVAIDNSFFAEHLSFRDELRSNPSLAADYLALKLELAARFVDDAQRYADAKGPFIRSVVSRLAAP